MSPKDKILEELGKIVKELTDDGSASSPQEEVKIELSKPSDPSHGDYTTNVAFSLSKKLGENPIQAAEKIASKFGNYSSSERSESRSEENNSSRQARTVNTFLKKIEVAKPGFINFYLPEEFLITHLSQLLEDPKKVALMGNVVNEPNGPKVPNGKFAGKRVIIEFTDPNPFKEFHIGHVYTNTVGESLARLHEAMGATVQRADYYGDVGMHIGKTLWGLQKKFVEDGISFEDLGKRSLNERIEYFGKSYAKGSTVYEDDRKAQLEIQKINKLVYIAAQKMWKAEKGISPQVDYLKGGKVDEKELDEIYELYTKGRSWSLEYFDGIYKRLGMKFTGDYPESLAGEKGYVLVKEHIKDGVFKEDNGAVIFTGEEHGLHTRVFINSLGLPTYEAKELGLAVWKNEEFPYDFSIILTGNEINEYFRVLMKALSLIRPDLASKSLHVGHGMVRLPEGKMSSRTGKIVTGEWLLDEAVNKAKELSKEGTDSQVSEMVGIGAIKYAFLKSSIGKDIEFDFETSLSLNGNSGPYIQYSYARTQSLLEKAKANSVILNEMKDLILKRDSSPSAQNDILTQEELQILRRLVQFQETVEKATENLAPNIVAEYLFDLSQEFNLFYQKHRIVDTPSQEEKEFRLGLTRGVGIILKQGLYLLGIQAPERM